MRRKHRWFHELSLVGWLGYAIVAWALLAFTAIIAVVAVAIFHEPPPD